MSRTLTPFFSNCAEISKLCSDCVGGGDIPLSVVTTQGYLGHNNQLFVQACKFHVVL